MFVAVECDAERASGWMRVQRAHVDWRTGGVSAGGERLWLRVGRGDW